MVMILAIEWGEISSVFRKDLSIKEGTEKLLKSVETENSFM